MGSVSKSRRVKRSVWMIATSIRELTKEGLARLVAKGLLLPEDRLVSNQAAFGMWLRRVLAADDRITQELTCMVRQTGAADTHGHARGETPAECNF